MARKVANRERERDMEQGEERGRWRTKKKENKFVFLFVFYNGEGRLPAELCRISEAILCSLGMALD